MKLFMGNEKFGKPSNPEYLLDNNELFNLLKDEMQLSHIKMV